MDEDRLVLIIGKQRELVLRAKEAGLHSWPTLSRELEVGTNYLKNEIAKEKVTLRRNVFEKLCRIAGQDYSKFITETKGKNWGRAKGGMNSTHHPQIPKLLIDKKSEELAEFFGIMLGDGGIYEVPSKSIYQVRITGHKHDEREYMYQYIPTLMKNLFNITPGIYEKGKHNTIVISKQSKNLVYTLKNFGLGSGNKKNYNEAPDWLFENKNFIQKFLRGLIDTDGSICPKTKKHRAPTIWFTTASP